MTFRVLVTDDVDPEGVVLLTAEPGLQVDEVPTLPREELLQRIGDYDAIVGRSATQITYDLSRALAKQWEPGDEIVVSRLDHDPTSDLLDAWLFRDYSSLGYQVRRLPVMRRVPDVLDCDEAFVTSSISGLTHITHLGGQRLRGDGTLTRALFGVYRQRVQAEIKKRRVV